jgi:YfiH family protein
MRSSRRRWQTQKRSHEGEAGPGPIDAVRDHAAANRLGNLTAIASARHRLPLQAALGEPFAWEGEHIGCALPGGRALFTTRRGGVSDAPYDTLNLGLFTDDDPAAVGSNRDRLAGLIGVPRRRTAQGRQVHGARVRRVLGAPDPAAELEPADGQATARTGTAAVVLTADCLPVALVAPEGVAIVHAGWRGLAADVLAEGVAALRELGAESDIAAAIGPGAGVCCYETGPEVHEAFAGYGPEARRGDHADLKLVARRQLARAGVGAVHDVGLCTICSAPELFFSHRRDGGLTGRQAGVVWRSS